MPTAVHEIAIGSLGLPGTLRIPDEAAGLVVFAHGSGSSRVSPRNTHVAEMMAERRLASLLFDLLTADEARMRSLVFDIPLLAERLVDAVREVTRAGPASQLPVGLFGASTGAAAALVAAGRLGERISCVVSRGGRPDLAHGALSEVKCPTLLIVGSRDPEVLELNRQAMRHLAGECAVEVIQGAGHLFEEPGKLDLVAEHAARWFLRFMTNGRKAVERLRPAR